MVGYNFPILFLIVDIFLNVYIFIFFIWIIFFYFNLKY